MKVANQIKTDAYSIGEKKKKKDGADFNLSRETTT
jgi:hypothetical protein